MKREIARTRMLFFFFFKLLLFFLYAYNFCLDIPSEKRVLSKENFNNQHLSVK